MAERRLTSEVIDDGKAKRICLRETQVHQQELSAEAARDAISAINSRIVGLQAQIAKLQERRDAIAEKLVEIEGEPGSRSAT